MGLSVFYTIILLGALQGIIFGFLLFFTHRFRYPNRILALILWIMGLASLNIYLNYTGWYYTSTTTAIAHAVIPVVIIMPLGPLIYFYIRSLFDQDFRISKKRLIHFLPVLIDLVPSFLTITFFLKVAVKGIDSGRETLGLFIDNYNVYSDIPRWVSITVYLSSSAWYLRHLKNTGYYRSPFFKWTRQFVLIFFVFQVIWLLYLIPYSLPHYTDIVLSNINWLPIYVPMAILIYWLGIKGYFQSVSSRAKTSASNLPLSTVQDAILLLHKSMEEDKIYCNPNLNMSILSQHTNVPQKTLSIVLNQHINKGFNEYINSYRVEDLKKKLGDSEFNHLTLAGIAMECGFSSKSSFQRIFKDITGLSPSEFRKSVH
jgi:AraC-like DNA-binding protein